MRAAAVQFFATPFNVAGNLETAERLVRQAAGQGARLIVLPELFNTGYVYAARLPALAEAESGPTVSALARWSRELGVVLAGALLLREGPHIYDACVLAQPDGQIHKYRKQHPFLWERCYFEAGRAPLVAETGLGRVGLMVCWDLAQPAVCAAYRGQVDLLVAASAAPRFHRAVLNFPRGQKVYLAQLLPWLLRERESIDRWFLEDVARRAAWLGVPVVHAAMAGRFVSEVPLPRLSLLLAGLGQPRYWGLLRQAHLASLRATFFGTSAVIGPQGEILAQAQGEEGLALAEVDGSQPRPGSGSLPVVPRALRQMEWLLKGWAERYYRQNAQRTAAG